LPKGIFVTYFSFVLPPNLKVDRFTPLPHGRLVRIYIKIDALVSKILQSQVQKWINKLTDRPTTGKHTASCGQSGLVET